MKILGRDQGHLRLSAQKRRHLQMFSESAKGKLSKKKRSKIAMKGGVSKAGKSSEAVYGRWPLTPGTEGRIARPGGASRVGGNSDGYLWVHLLKKKERGIIPSLRNHRHMAAKGLTSRPMTRKVAQGKSFKGDNLRWGKRRDAKGS